MSSVLESALEQSVLVVAHPDDEILWFGSIAARVGQIVICFSNDPVNPELAMARQRTLRQHPWADRIRCLGLDETNAFSSAAWPYPEPTEYGLDIVKAAHARRDYRICFKQLKKKLVPIVRGAANVFTHNPWGEYGHEEHVLVHRAVTAVATKHGTTVWSDNYASNWSEHLMRRYLGVPRPASFSVRTDTASLEAIADIYRANGAWTWFDGMDWFEEEEFISGPLQYRQDPAGGSPIAINMLQLPDRAPPRKEVQPSAVRRYLRRFLGG
jgi:hypothetical protein